MVKCDDIRDELRAMGVEFKSSLRKAELLEALRIAKEEAKAKATETDTPVDKNDHIKKIYQEVAFFRKNLFMLPRGPAGKDFIEEATKLINSFNSGSPLKPVALTLLMMMFPLLLQKPSSSSKARDHASALERRMALWHKGDYQCLLVECRGIQSRMANNRQAPKGILKAFSRLMLQGRVGAAIRVFRNGAVAPVAVTPDVIDKLKIKHPPPAEDDSAELVGPPTPADEFIFTEICEEGVRKAARLLAGSGGPSGSDTELWKKMLLSKQFGSKPQALCQAVAALARKLASEPIDPTHLEAFTASRLIPLSKKENGIRPIGIGEVLRRLIGKLITKTLKRDIVSSTAPLQLCGGLTSGVEAAVHAARAAFERDDVDCILMVDARNAFNSLNRQTALNNMTHVCPEFHRYLSNTYGLPSKLFVSDGENHEILLSREGTTQGDSAAMDMYSCSLMPFVRKISVTEGVITIFYADDGTGLGRLNRVAEWWSKVKEDGPAYGYYPDPGKSWLVVKEDLEDQAKEVFPDVNITSTGHRYLGSYIGNKLGQQKFVEQEVTRWLKDIETICNIAEHEPQLAYSAYTIGVSKEWSFLQRTTPGIEDQLHPVEDCIRRRLLPSITGQPYIEDIMREVMSLPTRFGGLGIPNPVLMSGLEYANSVAVTGHLTDAVLDQRFPFTPDHQREKEAKLGVWSTKNDLYKTMIGAIKSVMSPAAVRNLELLAEKGASSYLTCLPLEQFHFNLTKQEFQDSLSVRYNLPIVGQARPEECVCGNANTIEHALSCKRGGYVSIRHNRIRDYVAKELSEVCYDTRIEPPLQPVNLRQLPSGTNLDDGARLDVSTRGFWTSMDLAFFDIRVYNSQARSNNLQSISQTYRKHEQAKKTAYLQRVLEIEKGSFAPLVMATTGGMGRDFSFFVKRLAELKSRKSKNTYNDCIRFIRLKLSFSLIRSVTLSLRGYRGGPAESTTEDIYDI